MKRSKQPMPGFVREAILERRLMEAYLARPAYQQNDYVRWIVQAVRQETKDKRLAQMLDELERGSERARSRGAMYSALEGRRVNGPSA